MYHISKNKRSERFPLLLQRRSDRSQRTSCQIDPRLTRTSQNRYCFSRPERAIYEFVCDGARTHTTDAADYKFCLINLSRKVATRCRARFEHKNRSPGLGVLIGEKCNIVCSPIDGARTDRCEIGFLNLSAKCQTRA